MALFSLILIGAAVLFVASCVVALWLDLYNEQ